jgi:hypothetical protein
MSKDVSDAAVKMNLEEIPVEALSWRDCHPDQP